MNKIEMRRARRLGEKKRKRRGRGVGGNEESTGEKKGGRPKKWEGGGTIPSGPGEGKRRLSMRLGSLHTSIENRPITPLRIFGKKGRKSYSDPGHQNKKKGEEGVALRPSGWAKTIWNNY